jgi:hypothetical protein
MFKRYQPCSVYQSILFNNASHERRGFGNLMFPLWSALLGGSHLSLGHGSFHFVCKPLLMDEFHFAWFLLNHGLHVFLVVCMVLKKIERS